MSMFETALARETARYEALVTQKNRPADFYNGVITRWEHPVGAPGPGGRLPAPVAGRPSICAEARREGNAALVRFDHAGGGLRLEGGGFQLAGEDGAFRRADAQVISPDTVRVTAPGIAKPAAVRCAWYSFGPAGLYGGTGLAAAPLEQIL